MLTLYSVESARRRFPVRFIFFGLLGLIVYLFLPPAELGRDAVSLLWVREKTVNGKFLLAPEGPIESKPGTFFSFESTGRRGRHYMTIDASGSSILFFQPLKENERLLLAPDGAAYITYTKFGQSVIYHYGKVSVNLALDGFPRFLGDGRFVVLSGESTRLVVYERNGRRVTEIFPGGVVTVFEIDTDGNFVVGTDSGKFVWAQKKGEIYNLEKGTIPGRAVIKSAMLSENELYLRAGSPDFFYIYDGKLSGRSMGFDYPVPRPFRRANPILFQGEHTFHMLERDGSVILNASLPHMSWPPAKPLSTWKSFFLVERGREAYLYSMKSGIYFLAFFSQVRNAELKNDFLFIEAENSIALYRITS